MKHPSLYYIKYLILQDMDAVSINTHLKELGLPVMTKVILEDFNTFKTALIARTPRDFNMMDKDSAISISFLKKEEIYNLVYPNADVIACTRVLSCGQAKRDLILGLIGKLPMTELLRVVNIHNLDISEKTIIAFKHYYVNVSVLTVAEWSALIPTFASKDTEQFMATLQGGPAVAAYKLGLSKNATIRDTIQIAVDSIYSTIMEIRHWPASVDKVKMLAEIVGALSKAHDVMNSSDQELATVAKELRKFKMAKTQNKPVSLKVLSGGK